MTDINMEFMEVTPSKISSGRNKSDIWASFSDLPGVHNMEKADCKWCLCEFSFSKKVERVKKHLEKCSDFKRHLAELKNQNLPLSFREEIPKTYFISMGHLL